MNSVSLPWSRRAWLARTTTTLAALTTASALPRSGRRIPVPAARAARAAQQAERWDPSPLEAIARQGVDAARAAGATYADVRLTRKVGHVYGGGAGGASFFTDTELVGMGVRALVDGAWGFAACPWRTGEAVVGLARNAVAQARINAQGAAERVEVGTLPAVVGRWTTPVQIDPFAVPVEEKLDLLLWWQDVAEAHELSLGMANPQFCTFVFARQERVVATSDGSCFSQTTYETGGKVHIIPNGDSAAAKAAPIAGGAEVEGLTTAGQGWELLMNAKVPEQLSHGYETLRAKANGSKPMAVGRYTVVCDGATMAGLLARTLGMATQLDRALGYEANAGGTSFIDDPLRMVGQLSIASPLVTVTANRTAPTQLATVKWDDEGVAPAPFTLVKGGVLVDFQTTREQAAWLAPYYAKTGQPVASHGCAAAQDGLMTTMQMMPNLTLEPGSSNLRLEDLVADVRDGLLLEGGETYDVDFQGRNGLMAGAMREITNGRLGKAVTGGVLQFNALELWRHVQAIGGAATQQVIAAQSVETSGFLYGHSGGWNGAAKGEPAQVTSFSAQGVAAVIPNLPLINPRRKA